MSTSRTPPKKKPRLQGPSSLSPANMVDTIVKFIASPKDINSKIKTIQTAELYKLASTCSEISSKVISLIAKLKSSGSKLEVQSSESSARNIVPVISLAINNKLDIEEIKTIRITFCELHDLSVKCLNLSSTIMSTVRASLSSEDKPALNLPKKKLIQKVPKRRINQYQVSLEKILTSLQKNNTELATKLEPLFRAILNGTEVSEALKNIKPKDLLELTDSFYNALINKNLTASKVILHWLNDNMDNENKPTFDKLIVFLSTLAVVKRARSLRELLRSFVIKQPPTVSALDSLVAAELSGISSPSRGPDPFPQQSIIREASPVRSVISSSQSTQAAPSLASINPQLENSSLPISGHNISGISESEPSSGQVPSSMSFQSVPLPPQGSLLITPSAASHLQMEDSAPSIEPSDFPRQMGVVNPPPFYPTLEQAQAESKDVKLPFTGSLNAYDFRNWRFDKNTRIRVFGEKDSLVEESTYSADGWAKRMVVAPDGSNTSPRNIWFKKAAIKNNGIPKENDYLFLPTRDEVPDKKKYKSYYGFKLNQMRKFVKNYFLEYQKMPPLTFRAAKNSETLPLSPEVKNTKPKKRSIFPLLQSKPSGPPMAPQTHRWAAVQAQQQSQQSQILVSPTPQSPRTPLIQAPVTASPPPAGVSASVAQPFSIFPPSAAQLDQPPTLPRVPFPDDPPLTPLVSSRMLSEGDPDWWTTPLTPLMTPSPHALSYSTQELPAGEEESEFDLTVLSFPYSPKQ